MTVLSLSVDGLTVYFYPYHTHGVTNVYLFVSETLVGTATITNTHTGIASTLTTLIDMRTELSDTNPSPFSNNDQFLITHSVDVGGYSSIVDNVVVNLGSITSWNTIVLGSPSSITLTVIQPGFPIGTLAIYRMKNALIRSDVADASLQASLNAMSSIGAVEVTRFGPTNVNGYTWSITWTSVYGNTETCFSSSTSSIASCLQVYASSSSGLTIGGFTSTVYVDLNGYYVSDSFVNGRRQYKKVSGPFILYYESNPAASPAGWTFKLSSVQQYNTYNSYAASWSRSFDTASTSILPQSAAFATIACTVTVSQFSSSGGASKLLVGSSSSANIVGTVVQSGLAPSFNNIVVTHTLAERTAEVQSVTVTTGDGLLFGGFNLDFNNSNVPLYIRCDESADDFSYKLQSLPTVGLVNVTRVTLTNQMTAVFIGYQWFVTFLTDEGDLPLMKYNIHPAFDRTLVAGRNLTISIVEVVKGSPLPLLDFITGLVPGSPYSVEIYASNAIGPGIVSTTVQNDGMGVIPMSFNLFGETSSPSIVSFVPRSSSQMELDFTAPLNTGGSPVSRYLVEFTTNTTSTALSMSLNQTIRFQMYNRVGNDSEGYWRITWQDTSTSLIPWAASEFEVQEAINDLPSIEGAMVTRVTLPAHFGEGYQYAITLTNEIGPASLGKLTIDSSLLTSASLTDEFHIVIPNVTPMSAPVDYSVQWIYTDCAKIGTGQNSMHQVVTIYTPFAVYGTPDTTISPGTGSFRLTLGKSASTRCIPFTTTPASLQQVLQSDLSNAQDLIEHYQFKIREVYVEKYVRQDAFGSYIDFHVWFEGVSEDLSWPILRAEPFDLGISYNAVVYPNNACTVRQYSTTTVTVMAVDDTVACADGTPEIQVIVAESINTLPALGGYFYLSYKGQISAALDYDSTASEVENAINGFIGVSGVQVVKYIHNDAPFSGYAWTVKWPSSYGNVETLVTDDQYIVGVSAAVSIYPMFNITTSSDYSNDISGHFRIGFGAEFTVPLSFQATDSAVLNALHNLTNVGKVAMIGTRQYEQTTSITFTASSVVSFTAITSSACSTLVSPIYCTLTISQNTSTQFEVGDHITITDASLGVLPVNVITGIVYTSTLLTTITVGPVGSGPSSFTLSSAGGSSISSVAVGPLRISKTALPGYASIPSVTTIYSASLLATIIKVNDVISASNIWINGVKYGVVSSPLCYSTYAAHVGWAEGSIDTTHYCVTISTTYSGPVIVDGVNTIPVFADVSNSIKMWISKPWTSLNLAADPNVAAGDSIWIGDDQFTVVAVGWPGSTSYITVQGANVLNAYEGATAFVSANGFERALIFKLATDDVRTARVLLESDWRGTNVQVRTARMDGILPLTYQLGALSEVQTVTFRSNFDFMTNTSVHNHDTSFTLQLGNDVTSYVKFGAQPSAWKTALESLACVDRVTVERNGDGLSAVWSYGYSYTISFWGKYGTEGIPQLVVVPYTLNSTAILVSVNTLRNAEYLADYSARHLALDQNREFSLRVSAINAKGISLPSVLVQASTENYGDLPDMPQSFRLGQYVSEDSLSLTYLTPQYTGGLPITQYVIETDSSTAFDPSSPYYNSTSLMIIPEVQQITIYFRSGDNVKVCLCLMFNVFFFSYNNVLIYFYRVAGARLL